MTDSFARFLDEASRDLVDLFLDDTTAAPGSAPLNAQKVTGHIPVSCCYLTDTDMTGENHCEHPPVVVKPLPWTWRARERWWDLRELVARKLAGHRWPNEEE